MKMTRCYWLLCVAVLSSRICCGTSSSGSEGASQVITLTDESFQEKVMKKFKLQDKTDNELWLIEFYAPWCGVCQRLAPILDEVSVSVKGKMKIGLVDATMEKKLKEEYAITSFPSLFYARDGALKPYNGGRSKESLESFAERMSLPAVVEVDSWIQVDSFLEKSDALYLHGKINGESPYTMYEKLARKHQDSIMFLQSESKEVLARFFRSDSFIAKMEKNEEPVLYTTLSDAADEDNLEKWILRNQFSIFPALDSSNFQAIADSGRLLVITCKGDDIDKNMAALQVLGDLARPQISKLPQEVLKQFIFGHLDCIRFGSYVAQFFVYRDDLPVVFVLDKKNAQFFQRQHLPIRNENITEFLLAISSGAERPIYQGVKGYPYKAYRFAEFYYPYSLLIVFPVGLLLFLVSLCVYNLAFVNMEIEMDDEEKREIKAFQQRMRTKKKV